MNTLLRAKLFNVCNDKNAYLVPHDIFQYVSKIHADNQCPLLLTWFNFNPSMAK